MRISLAAFITTIGLVLALAGPAGAATKLPDDFAGMNAQWVFTAPRANWDTHLAAIAAGGIRGVRSDATWAAAEPSAPVNGVHTYSLAYFDAIVSALARRGLRWQPVLGYSAKWASQIPGDEHAPPTSAANYAAFAAAFAARYGEGGAFWTAHPELRAIPVRSYEIWNEENLSAFWHTGVNAGGYADLYAAAREAIHAKVSGRARSWSAA